MPIVTRGQEQTVKGLLKDINNRRPLVFSELDRAPLELHSFPGMSGIYRVNQRRTDLSASAASATEAEILPDVTQAIFKTGIDRAMNDLAMENLLTLLNMSEFLPRSKIVSLVIRDCLPPPVLGRASPKKKKISLDDDESFTRVLTPNPQQEYEISHRQLSESPNETLGSLQKFEIDEPEIEVQPIQAGKIVILAYLVFLKDLKANGIIKTTTGIKLIDIEENAIKYSSCLSDEDAVNEQIASMNLPIMHEWESLILSHVDVNNLYEHFSALLQSEYNFSTALLTLLHFNTAQLSKLGEHMEPAAGRVMKTSFHLGHQFVTAEKLTQIIHARLMKVVLALDEMRKSQNVHTILDLAGRLDEMYGVTYAQWLDKPYLTRDQDQFCSGMTVAAVVGFCQRPRAPRVEQTNNICNSITKMLDHSTQLIAMLSMAEAMPPKPFRTKTKKSVEGILSLYADIVRSTPVEHPEVAFPRGSTQFNLLLIVMKNLFLINESRQYERYRYITESLVAPHRELNAHITEEDKAAIVSTIAIEQEQEVDGESDLGRSFSHSPAHGTTTSSSRDTPAEIASYIRDNVSEAQRMGIISPPQAVEHEEKVDGAAHTLSSPPPPVLFVTKSRTPDTGCLTPVARLGGLDVATTLGGTDPTTPLRHSAFRLMSRTSSSTSLDDTAVSTVMRPVKPS